MCPLLLLAVTDLLWQGEIDTNKPFRHPCIADIIQDYLFNRRQEWLEGFLYSLKEEWKNMTIEHILAALVSLVATAVRIFFLPSVSTVDSV